MLTFDAPWDAPAADPFPVLRRYSAASPATMAELPAALGAHPFAPIVEAHPDPVLAHHAPTPVALDPGADLSDWACLDWQAVDGPVGVTTTGLADGYTVPLQRLADFASNWATPRVVDTPSTIDVDSRLTRRVGRGGALVDALLADPDVEVDEHLVVYDDGDPGGFVADEASRLGKRGFARRTQLPPTVAGRPATGGRMAHHNTERALAALLTETTERFCALEGCRHVINRPNAVYCTKAHRDRAHRLRKRATASRRPSDEPVCPRCGTVVMGSALKACPVCKNTDQTSKRSDR